MSTLQFPVNPNVGDLYTKDNVTWEFTSNGAWELESSLFQTVYLRTDGSNQMTQDLVIEKQSSSDVRVIGRNSGNEFIVYATVGGEIRVAFGDGTGTVIADAIIMQNGQPLAVQDQVLLSRDPVAAFEAATMQYVQNEIAGLGSLYMLISTYDPQGISADCFARANHTGTQAIATIDGLQAALDDKADFSDLANYMLIATYDPQGVNGDAFDRANHTGTQPISSIDNLQTELDDKASLTDDNAYTGVNYFDLTTSGSFFALDSPDPLTVNPTYGMGVFFDTGLSESVCLWAADSAQIGGNFGTGCGAIFGYAHTKNNVTLYRTASADPGGLDIFNQNGPVNIDSNTDVTLGGSGRQIVGVETVTTATGKAILYYDVLGNCVHAEQFGRVVTVAGLPVEVDFPVDWTTLGITDYTGNVCVSDSAGVPVGVALEASWVSSLSDNDSFQCALVDTVSGTIIVGQLDYTFRGQP